MPRKYRDMPSASNSMRTLKNTSQAVGTRRKKRSRPPDSPEHAGGANRCTNEENGFVSVTNACVGHSDVPSVEDDEGIATNMPENVRTRENH